MEETTVADRFVGAAGREGGVAVASLDQAEEPAAL